MSNAPARCSKSEELNKLVRVMLELAIAEIKAHGVNPLVVETFRSQERQNYLYCQGRTIAECTAKGISSSFAKAYCNVSVGKKTWTLKSVHTTRKAVDVVPQRVINGKMTAIWNTNDSQTQIIIKIMQKYGFEAGANWTTTPDSPHFQVKGSFASVFKKGCNTTYVAKAIQTALGIVTDGKWGAKTTDAVNMFRKSQKYKDVTSGQLGATALRVLLSRL